MVIGKGSSYGYECDLDPTWPTLGDDAALAAHIDENGSAPCTVTGGDLLTTLGGGAPLGVSPRAYPVDLLRVDLDGMHTFVAVAHVVARRTLWIGQFFVAMNAGWVDGMYLGPRSHPNDGLVDVTTGALSWQQLWLARRRAVTGTHIPHPDLTVSRKQEAFHRFSRPTTVRIDGRRTVRATRISVKVRPDAGIVVL